MGKSQRTKEGNITAGFKELAWEPGALNLGLALALTSSRIFNVVFHLPGSQFAKLLSKRFELSSSKKLSSSKLQDSNYNQSLFIDLFLFLVKGLHAQLLLHHQVASVNLGLCVKYFIFLLWAPTFFFIVLSLVALESQPQLLILLFFDFLSALLLGLKKRAFAKKDVEVGLSFARLWPLIGLPHLRRAWGGEVCLLLTEGSSEQDSLAIMGKECL